MRFKKYRKRNIAEMHKCNPNDMYLKEVMDRVSVSKADLKNGSPKEGDMIAINLENHNELWLVGKNCFKQNFKEHE